MSPEERQLLTGLFDRVQSAANNPRDKEAEAFIADATRALPYAPYLLAQTVIVQDQALQAANARLQELEGKVRDLEQRAAQQPSGSGGFLSGLGSLFGAGSPPPRGPIPPAGNRWQQSPPPSGWQPPPQQGYGQPSPPPQQAGPWGAQGMGQGMGQAPSQGGGFLKGALGAAAGVAGGVLLADSIRGLFGGHNNPLGIGSGFGGGLGGAGGGETIVNNYYGSDDQDLGQQDAMQDADQDQDDIQDASDYSSDFGSGDDNGTDI